MLVLSRKIGERIVIGNSVLVTVIEVDRNKVRLGISAPDDVSILREELTFTEEMAEAERESPTLTTRDEASWSVASEVFLG
jgi:carbon storage regulator